MLRLINNYKKSLALSLFCTGFLVAPAAKADVFISVRIGPPVLPLYVQPPCPQPNYLWVPGYWAYGPMGYFWVPGVWVAAPQPGYLWTPGYWGFVGGIYTWHPGYWGPHVGFYGGINYGFGYTGIGFIGGVWAGSIFRYNTAVVHVNQTVIRNVYVDRTVIRNTTVVNRMAFNGPGGIQAQPTPQDRMYDRERHFQATPVQFQHERQASQDRNQFASVNHGRPATASMDTIGGRRYNEQARIANGIKSGQLNPNQAAHLENREANINREVHNDRQANGGTLTPRERNQVRNQQGATSRDIYAEKHGQPAPHQNHPANHPNHEPREEDHHDPR